MYSDRDAAWNHSLFILYIWIREQFYCIQLSEEAGLAKPCMGCLKGSCLDCSHLGGGSWVDIWHIPSTSTHRPGKESPFPQVRGNEVLAMALLIQQHTFTQHLICLPLRTHPGCPPLPTGPQAPKPWAKISPASFKLFVARSQKWLMYRQHKKKKKLEY